MATVGELNVKLGVDESGLKKGFSSALSATKKLGAKLGGGLTSIGKVASKAIITSTKVALGAVTALGAGMVALGTKAFLAAASVDELVAVNEVLAKNAGLSQKAVKAEAAEVKSMGIEAAASERIVAEFIKAELELAKASDIARLAQDAAVISQSNSSEAAAQITLGITKMNPLILRNQGIIVDAVTAYERYADANDLVAKELTKAQQVQAFMNEVLLQGEKIAGAYAAAMNEPGKVLRSFPRYFNDIFVAIGSVIKPLFGESVFAIAGFLKELTKAVEVGGALRPVLEKIKQIVEPLVELFVHFVKNVDFQKMANNLMPVLDSLMNWPSTVMGIIETVKNFFSGGLDIGDILGDLRSGLFANQGKFIGIGLSLINSLIEGIIGAIPILAETAILILEQLVRFITRSLYKIVDVSLPLIITLVNAIIEALPSLLIAALNIVLALAYGIIDALPTLIPAIVETLLTIVNVIVENLPIIIDVALKLILALIDGILIALPSLIEVIPVLIDVIVDTLITLLPVITDAALQIILALVNGFANNWPLIMGAILDIADILIEGIIALVPEIWNAGKYLIEGLIEGMKSIDFGSFMANLADEVVGGFKRIFKIESKSKVMQEEIGKNLGLGMIPDAKSLQGIQGGISNMFNAVMGGIPGGGVQSAAAGSGDITLVIENISIPNADPETAAQAGRILGREAATELARRRGNF